MERRTLLIVLLVCSFLLLAVTAEASPRVRRRYGRPFGGRPFVGGQFGGRPGCVCIRSPCPCANYG
uniref:Arasin n=1 Tax=Scylla serrata TaxID=6761 RepID=A0A482CP43_SCYSE|nr:arasin [Scylla serrata]